MCNDRQKLFGYWGKFKTIKGVSKKVYIGPMSYQSMINNHDTYRHNFRETKPAN